MSLLTDSQTSDHVLSSFTETQRLATPSLADIDTYRTYLATQQPITEIETRFLDGVEDLITLAPAAGGRSPSPSDSAVEYLRSLDDEAAALTPIPRAATAPQFATSFGSAASSTASPRSSRPPTAQQQFPDEPAAPLVSGELPHLAIATAVAVLVPILTFAVIPGFIGRMTVVLLVAMAVFGTQVQAGTLALASDGLGKAASRDLLLCAAVYGGVMAVTAGLFA